MLNDPSVEFRRDAVARLIGEAENDESSSKADAARETYHKALSAVRDLDQVQAIVKKLEGFGEKVDLNAPLWLLDQVEIDRPLRQHRREGL